MFISDSVGGDFIGQVVKNGDVHFLFEEDAKRLTNFKLVVGGAHDADFNKLSEDLNFELEF
ncbi:hypothetical protein [Jeotgalibaca sp. A127]